MIVLKWIVMLTVGGYVAVISLLYLAQRRFVFVPPEAGHPTPAAAGWPEAECRASQYLSAVTKCSPGKSSSGRGDRVPTAAERELCRPWRERELALIRPSLIIPIGRVAIEQFLPELKGRPLERFISQLFERDGLQIVPLPHPSGVNRWLNRPENRARVDEALARLGKLRQALEVE